MKRWGRMILISVLVGAGVPSMGDDRASMEAIVELRSAGAKVKAAKALEKILERSPENVRALVQLGAVYQDMKMWEEAGACYGKALLIDPHDSAAQRNFEHLVVLREMNRPARGAKPLKDILISEGLSAAGAGEYERSKKLFRLFRGVFPKDRSWLFYLAMISERQGDLESAIRLYRKLLRFAPQYSPARINLILALYEKGKLEEARIQAQRAMEISPYNSRIKSLVKILEDIHKGGGAVAASQAKGTQSARR